MSFEAYLVGKKIDSKAFSLAEPDLFTAWRNEFDQMHPNSFTVQKLNLINPIRRKYPLKEIPPVPESPQQTPVTPAAAKPGKPIMKPKPKFN